MSNRIVTRHISPYVAIQGPDRNLMPVPNPMASFEDTTHAYECGYRDGQKAAQLSARSNGDVSTRSKPPQNYSLGLMRFLCVIREAHATLASGKEDEGAATGRDGSLSLGMTQPFRS